MRTGIGIAVLAALVMPGTETARTQESVTVFIDGLTFVPPRLPVAAGQTITWVNRDFVEHTVTANDGRFDLTLAAGASASLVAGPDGEIAYYCRVHPNMRGVIDARAAPPLR